MTITGIIPAFTCTGWHYVVHFNLVSHATKFASGCALHTHTHTRFFCLHVSSLHGNFILNIVDICCIISNMLNYENILNEHVYAYIYIYIYICVCVWNLLYASILLFYIILQMLFIQLKSAPSRSCPHWDRRQRYHNNFDHRGESDKQGATFCAHYGTPRNHRQNQAALSCPLHGWEWQNQGQIVKPNWIKLN